MTTEQQKPGFTPEEIQATYNRGETITAVKMLRAETGCGLAEAVSALRHGALESFPTFKEIRAKRKAERHGPAMLKTLQAVQKESRRIVHPDSTDNRLFNIDKLVTAMITEVEKE